MASLQTSNLDSESDHLRLAWTEPHSETERTTKIGREPIQISMVLHVGIHIYTETMPTVPYILPFVTAASLLLDDSAAPRTKCDRRCSHVAPTSRALASPWRHNN